MASRIRGFDKQLTSGKNSVTLPVPSGTNEIQIVIDRTRFEVPDLANRIDLIAVSLTSAGVHLGGVAFGNHRVDEVTGPRPGQRMLWSTARWPVPDITDVTVTIDARVPFNCLLDVDFF